MAFLATKMDYTFFIKKLITTIPNTKNSKYISTYNQPSQERKAYTTSDFNIAQSFNEDRKDKKTANL